MAAEYLTLVDRAKRLDPKNEIRDIIELLAQRNEMLQDIPFIEGNQETGHVTTVRTGLPSVFWRLLNMGVLPSKSHTAQITEHIGQLEAYSQVDVALAELGGNAGALRLSEAKAFLESMNQEAMSTMIYGTSLAPEEFVGLATRYSDTTAGNGDNIIKAGGTGSTDNTSVWVAQWDEDTVCGIFPKGSSMGLQHEDLGKQLIQNAGAVTGALMTAYVDHWMWKLGLCLKDWRHVVRICNVDVSNLASASDAADLIYYLQDAEARFPYSTGKRAIYMNRTVFRYLQHQAYTAVKNGGGLTYGNVDGKRIAVFGTTPIRIVDALLNTEDVVV